MILDREVAAGVVQRNLRTGAWIRVRRGAFTPTRELTDEQYGRARQLALAHAAATLRQSAPDAVLSHDTAALVRGLPLLDLPGRTHLVQEGRRAGNAADDVVRHHRAHAPSEREEVHGLAVTPMARTVVDCACALGVRAGLVVADAALAAGLDRQECAEIVADSPGMRGIRAARAVVDLADDGAESPGETIARWTLLHAGLPCPETQVAVETHLGVFWLDLGWPQWRLGVEYDGTGKYLDTPRATVLAEKRRQEAIEEAGWRLIRVTSADLRVPLTLAARVRRALGTTPAPMRPRRDIAC